MQDGIVLTPLLLVEVTVITLALGTAFGRWLDTLPPMDFWDVLIAIHLLAMAFFVGGQLILAIVLVPVLKGTPEMKQAAKRFGQTSIVALVLIILSGVYLATHFHQWGSHTLWAKLALLVVLFALMAYHVKEGQKRWIDPVLGTVSLVIVILGVALAH